jgi:methylmalonyl-CoA mutase cobalamin-binding subunit
MDGSDMRGIDTAGPLPNSRGAVVIGATRSDAHVVSVYLVSLMLEERGFEVVNLSCCNPSRAFFDLDLPTPPRAVVIANQNGQALDDLADLAAARGRATVPVILGGHYQVGCVKDPAVDDALRAAGVDHFVSTPDELMTLLEALS